MKKEPTPYLKLPLKIEFNFLGNIPWRKKKLYLIIGSSLVISYDSYWFGTSGIHILEVCRNLFVLFLPVFLFLTDRNLKISQRNVGILVSLILFFQIESIFNGITYGAPVLILSGVFLALALIPKYSLKEITSCFSNFIQVISIYSIIVLIGVFIGSLSIKILDHGFNEHILTAGGCLYFPEIDSQLIRNSAIFREPGVFMIMINMSIIFELFLVRKKNMWRNVGILVLALLSSLSTGGIFCFGIIIITYVIKSIKGVVKFCVLGFLIFILLIPLIDEDIINFILGKFDNLDSYGSGFARYSSLIIPMNIYFENPILGSGDMFPADYIRVGYEVFHRYVNPSGMSTNTIANMFAIWGTLLGGFIVFGLYKFTQRIGKNRGMVTSILLLIDVIILLSNESMPYWSFLYIFIFYGISPEKFNIVAKNE